MAADDMLSWLRNVIEGDKAAAERATPPPPFVLTEDADHLMRQNPRDTIARCEAELAMLDKLPPVLSRLGWIAEGEGQGAPHPGRPGEYMAEDAVADYFVKLLASGYRHRPGFRPEWVED